MIADIATSAEPVPAADPLHYSRAILNILDDFGEEKVRMGDSQKAILNILEDSGTEKLRVETDQKAIFNILEDVSEDKERLADTQKAIVNILEDVDAEKNKLDHTNQEMAVEVAERQRAEEQVKNLNASLEQRVVERTVQLEAANKELEAFSYSVSHDLRAPLRSIDGFSRILLEDYNDKLDAEGRDSLNRVRAATQRMGRLIDDLLNLSRISRAQMRCERVDLSAAARAVAAELQQQQPDRRATFVVADGMAAEGDPHLLRVVLENLLGNSWKFTGKRDAAIIEFDQAQRDGQTAYFVRDNGAGFDMTYADKLFGAFQRLHAGTDFIGTGIGLTTVQRIIHRHGGRVWAEGEVSKGATFYFTLKPKG
ncbi:MAG: hypothetical protein HZA50_17815 [Planctomycetes bacterium]|nr:hypothetical protein [Planctomycetota bacterium]